MNYGIGNVKEKISGGTPTITIDVSQMIDQTTAQLTNEQYEIIENNGFINVVFPNSQSCGFNRFIDAYGDYHLAMCSGGASEITYFSVSINSTTKIATISIGDFSGGGGGAGTTLYQHNLVITNSNFGYNFAITIINDNNTAINSVSTLQTYLSSKGYKTTSKMLKASGAMTADSVLAVAEGIYYDGTIRVQCVKSNGTTNGAITSNNGSTIKDDNIIAL